MRSKVTVRYFKVTNLVFSFVFFAFVKSTLRHFVRLIEKLVIKIPCTFSQPALSIRSAHCTSFHVVVIYLQRFFRDQEIKIAYSFFASMSSVTK